MAKKAVKKLIARVDDVPVTHREIKAINKQISSLRIVMEKGFGSIDKKFVSVDKRFDSIDKRFASVDKRFDSLMDRLDSRFAQISAENQRWLAIYEEQDARNKVVMDSQGMIQENFDQHDSRISSLEERVFGIKSK